MTTVTLRRTIALLGLSVFGFGAGCTSTQREGRSPAYLVIDTLEAASGADDQQFSSVLNSDVETNGGILQDPGQVKLSLGLKDIGGPDNPTSPTTNNFITVNRYHVEYRRADGRNQPGVDVPYAFDGAASGTVKESAATLVFTLVRIQAKLESPLINLQGHGGALAISTIADVTFYGKDQAGNEVAVTGSISVNFADWADPKSAS
jgi:hypothetical protein